MELNQVTRYLSVTKKSMSQNIDQMVIPLHSILFSSSFDTGLHNTSRPSQMLNTSNRSSHEFGIIPRSRDTPQSSHNVGPSNVQQSPVGGGYTIRVVLTSPHQTYTLSSPERSPMRLISTLYCNIVPVKTKIWFTSWNIYNYSLGGDFELQLTGPYSRFGVIYWTLRRTWYSRDRLSKYFIWWHGDLTVR